MMNYLVLFSLILIQASLFSQKNIYVKNTIYDDVKGVLTDHKGLPINGIVYDTHKKNKVSWEKEYQNGKQHGLSQEWNSSGKLISQCYFQDGKKEGLQKYWRGNGNPFYEETIKDNVLDGLKKYYFFDGNVFYEENYTNGKLNGAYKIYYSSGQKMLECNYLNGKMDDAHKTWFENGNLKTETFFRNGLLNGTRKVWFENGVLAYENNTKNGLLHGTKKGWFENGNIKFENTLENDKLTGIQRYFDENGNVVTESNLINGNGKIILKGKNDNEVFERVYKDSVLYSEKRWSDVGKIIYNRLQDSLYVWYENGKLCSVSSFKDKELIDKNCWMTNGQKYDLTNITGCESDLDKDGVCDCNDRCPELAGESDNYGCPFNQIQNKYSDTYFPGGEIELQTFLAENIKFPEICMDMDAQGRVFVKFTIEKDGSISNIQIETNRTGCHDFAKEAERVLNLMPKWIPGEESGSLKRTICRLPFNFRLN
jgi:antitoxin component YwqK of YwqJK toxin-antitoxin module